MKKKKRRALPSRKKKSILPWLFLFSVLFIPFGMNKFTFIVEDILTQAGADSVSVGKVSVSLLRGICIENLSTYKRRNAQEYYTVHISRIFIRGKIPALGSMVLGREKGGKVKRDIFMEVYSKPIGLVSEAFSGLAALGLLKEIEFNNASIRFMNKGKVNVSAENAAAKLSINGGIFKGKASIAGIVIASMGKIENFSVNLKSGDGKQLDLFDAKGKVFGGKFNAQSSINLKNSKIFGTRMHIKEVDVKQSWEQFKISSGGIEGKADLDLEIEPFRFNAFALAKLKGNFCVNKLIAVDLPLQKLPIINKVSPKLRTIQFSEVKGKFTFSKKNINFDEISGVGDVMNFKSVGSFNIDNGKIYQNFEGEFSEEFIATQLPRLVRNSLEITENGGGRFKCTISQTFQNPRVKVDKSVIKTGIKNMFKK
ncbi:MAG: hypothetical protein LBH98_07460 [Chitinispirillales bacterium]|jgi:hypothetical protein|nr:hypothetical protein [Chitinispirillales bacterium]